MKICKNCGKEYHNKNKVFCSQKCRTENLKNTRVCIICGKIFWTAPSSMVVTCSQECETINRSMIGKSDENLKKLEAAREAAAESPNIGNFDTNVHAKSWGLVSPDGILYEISNLSKWCQEHKDIIPYTNPKAFVVQLYKIKAGKVNNVGGWTLKWWSEENKARKSMQDLSEHPKQHKKRTKMSDEERLSRKRESARKYYRKKKRNG